MDTIKHAMNVRRVPCTASYKLQALVVQTMNSHSPATIIGHTFTRSPAHWLVHAHKWMRTWLHSVMAGFSCNACPCKVNQTKLTTSGIGYMKHKRHRVASGSSHGRGHLCTRCLASPAPRRVSSIRSQMQSLSCTHTPHTIHAHTFAFIHSPAKPTKTCSDDVGQHA